MKRALLTLLILWGFFLPYANAFTLSGGVSGRPYSYVISARGAGQVAPEIEFISEGKQPLNIPNINRVLMLNVVATKSLQEYLQVFGKLGLASSRFSTNGSGNNYKNPGKPGWDVSLGATYWITRNWGLRVETLYLHYQQSDIPDFENFTLTSVQLVWNF